ncbi:hypothetical protein ACHEHF_004256 [Salmonella enterica subsp. enterica serovar Kiambu]
MATKHINDELWNRIEALTVKANATHGLLRPLSAPCVPGAASNDVASVEIHVKAIEQAVNAVLSVDTVTAKITGSQ